MLHDLIEKVSDHPRVFLYCRGLLEANFTVIRETIREQLGADPARRVLDVACGPGAFSDLFSAETYVGVDINRNYIDYAKRNYRGRFSVQDARKPDFPDASFDDALVFGLLHHLGDEDVTAVLTTMKRVLRPGGRALFIEDIPTVSRRNVVGRLLHWIENGHHIRSAASYRRLLEAHLEIHAERCFRSGVCDYYMARTATAQDAARSP